MEQVVDRAATVSTVWLGLSMGCAQCHDHKYDPITQKEFYQLYAFFNNANEDVLDAPLAGEMGPYLQSTPAEASYDLILLDAYQAGGVPLHLCTREFYAECRAHLTSAGVVATNLQASTPLYDAARKTFAVSFRHTATFPLLGGNVILIGSDAERLSLQQIRERASAVQERYRCDFSLPEWAQALASAAPYRQNTPILHDVAPPA